MTCPYSKTVSLLKIFSDDLSTLNKAFAASLPALKSQKLLKCEAV